MYTKSTRKKVLHWFLCLLPMVPTITGLIFLLIVGFELCPSDWTSLISAWLGSTGTLLLGIVVYFQTEKHKARQVEENQVYREQEEFNRKQQLKIQANPIVYLKGLSRIEFNTIGCLTYLLGDHNVLIDDDLIEESRYFDSFFSLDIAFDNSFGKTLDFITIKKATLVGEKNSFIDDNYERILFYSFKNNSPKKAIIRIGEERECVALLQLYSDKFNEEKDHIIKSLQNDSLNWILRFEYELSNSIGVYITLESQIRFKIKQFKESPLGVSIDFDQTQRITWQRSGVEVQDIKK